MILHREDLDVEPLYQLAFGKRPREELYHLPSDPAYMRNLAGEPEHEAVRAELQVRNADVRANSTSSARNREFE